MKINELAKNWLEYSWQYRPSAFYFWNEDMDEERMEQMFAHMERDCIRETLFHPVHGLTIEYLSDKFFEKYKKALQMAKNHNLKVWIYDEYSWPTGCVAGFVFKAHPEYRGWYLACENGVIEPRRSNRLHDGCVGAPWTWEEKGYIDTLNFDAMKCFIDMNYAKLKEGCGEYWDDVILGFFTDEPATMMPYDTGNFWNMQALPWTEKLPATFKELNGYDIEPYYSELFKKEKNKYKTDYFKAVKYLHCNAYHKQIGDWCKANGKFYTGHLGEDSLHQQVRYGGSLYQSLSNMTHPGVDFLNCVDPDRKIDQEIVASVAKHSSEGTSKKVYMEAYGISPYTLTLAEMYYKWAALSVQRVNDIALMGMQHSTSSVRKRTYWPPFTDDEPWWSYYPIFRDGASRVTGISNLGKDIRNYAIMYPQYEIEQESTNVIEGKDRLTENAIDIINTICNSHNQYDWIFPEIMDTAKAEKGKIVFPNETYDAIIATKEWDYFPETKNILDKLEAQGCKIIRDEISKIKLEKPLWENILSVPELTETDEEVEKVVAPEWTNVINTEKNALSRIYTYEYEDGYLFSLRNITDKMTICNISLKDKSYNLTLWNPLNGKIYNVDKINQKIRPHANIFFSVTKDKLDTVDLPEINNKNLDIKFTAKAVNYNTAPFNAVRVLKDNKYIDITKIPANKTALGKFYGEKNDNVLNNHPFPMLPPEFKGCEKIKCSCDFYVKDLTKIGILFEGKYLSDLSVNGNKIDHNGISEFIWDYSNIYKDFSEYVKLGENNIEFTLNFEKWETSIINDAFFCHGPMPSIDVCLAGDFIYIDNSIQKYSETPKSIPLYLENEGFKYTYGKVILTGEFNKTEDMKNLLIKLKGDSACEILIDNKTVGACITEYMYNIENISNGIHKIDVILTGTSASLMDYKEANTIDLLSISY